MSCSLQSPRRLILSRDTEEGAPLTGRAPFLYRRRPLRRCCILTATALRMRSAAKHIAGTHAIFSGDADIAGRSSRRAGGRSNGRRPPSLRRTGHRFGEIGRNNDHAHRCRRNGRGAPPDLAPRSRQSTAFCSCYPRSGFCRTGKQETNLEAHARRWPGSSWAPNLVPSSKYGGRRHSPVVERLARTEK